VYHHQKSKRERKKKSLAWRSFATGNAACLIFRLLDFIQNQHACPYNGIIKEESQ
jgi:hypothetical protein